MISASSARQSGIEATGADLDLIPVLHAAGLRTLGPVWGRPNIFAHGVPFRFGQAPDIGPGLTEAGRDLVRLCNRLKIMVDLSHMNDAGLWDIAKISDAPLVASFFSVRCMRSCRPFSWGRPDHALERDAEPQPPHRQL
ncbi:membrane dipeptidase (peptidase family M19) [Rhizobium sullae]|uniref:Membrane dipeptidase (Peptidase family M19) n=1 Tax=Rhizobium sullae TaxID=50338 RepID=A0A4R3PRZ3_RHISU|nr:membrane dipeptidase (peptidase family M19) [Rhizobium sullae]